MKTHVLIMMLGVFLLGWIGSTLFAYGGIAMQTMPSVTVPDVNIGSVNLDAPKKEHTQFTEPVEQISPYDHISESQIHVLRDRVIIDIPNAEWAKFTDTNSMDPVLDEGANAIEFIPKSTSDVHVGDIVSYHSEITDSTIIHRIVEIGNDENGWYAYFKGDNIPILDPERVRFEQLRRVVVAIIY